MKLDFSLEKVEITLHTCGSVYQIADNLNSWSATFSRSTWLNTWKEHWRGRAERNTCYEHHSMRCFLAYFLKFTLKVFSCNTPNCFSHIQTPSMRALHYLLQETVQKAAERENGKRRSNAVDDEQRTFLRQRKNGPRKINIQLLNDVSDDSLYLSCKSSETQFDQKQPCAREIFSVLK